MMYTLLRSARLALHILSESIVLLGSCDFFRRDYTIYGPEHVCTRALFVYCFLERGIFAQSGLFALPRMPHSFAPLIRPVLIYKFDVLLVVFLAKSVFYLEHLHPKSESLHAED